MVGKNLPGFAIIRALRLVRMFRLMAIFKGPFDLITAAFTDSFTTLSTILFLVVLSGAIASALILAVEAQKTDALTQVRLPIRSLCGMGDRQGQLFARHCCVCCLLSNSGKFLSDLIGAHCYLWMRPAQLHLSRSAYECETELAVSPLHSVSQPVAKSASDAACTFRIWASPSTAIFACLRQYEV
jgi:hypothetical protein